MKIIRQFMASTFVIIWSLSAIAHHGGGQARKNGCTGFSDERRDRKAGVRWSYRFCGTGKGPEVHMRFRNVQTEPTAFQVNLYTRPLAACSDTTVTPDAVANLRLVVGTSVLVPLRLPRKTVSDRIWMCFSVQDDEVKINLEGSSVWKRMLK